MASGESVLFREEQSFPQLRLRITLAIPPLILGGFTFWQVVLGHPIGKQPPSNASLITLTIFLVIVYLRLVTVRLSTDVTPERIRVRMRGFWRERRLAPADIKSMKVITYDPIREFGGYGIRKTRRGTVMIAGGRRGVRLELSSGGVVVIGSTKPDELLSAIRKARREEAS